VASKLRDRALVVLLAAAALAAGYVAYSSVAAVPDVSALTEAKFRNLDGNESRISDWQGKVRVINFWATWCTPCREEIPAFVRLQDEYRENGIVFIGIALDDEQKVRRFAAEVGMNYPVLLASYTAMDLSRSAGNRLRALPFTVLIEEDGDFAHAFSGIVKEAELKEKLERAVDRR
jgi:thiol-disulfide isomerase/thioredoxin